jgi:hypothetical protein
MNDHALWSAPLRRYHAELHRSIGFATLVVTHPARTDEAMEEALAELEEALEEAPIELTELRLRFLRNQLAFAEGVLKYQDLLCEMLITRSIDNYLTYVAELLALVFRTRPEALRSREQVRLDFVLQHQSMGDLLEALTERRVERLSRSGLSELNTGLASDLGFALFDDQEDLIRASKYVELRNLIVHNRGIVNRRLLGRFPETKRGLGERIEVTLDQLQDATTLFNAAAHRADVVAAKKWEIPRSPAEQPSTKPDP